MITIQEAIALVENWRLTPSHIHDVDREWHDVMALLRSLESAQQQPAEDKRLADATRELLRASAQYDSVADDGTCCLIVHVALWQKLCRCVQQYGKSEKTSQAAGSDQVPDGRTSEAAKSPEPSDSLPPGDEQFIMSPLKVDAQPPAPSPAESSEAKGRYEFRKYDDGWEIDAGNWFACFSTITGDYPAAEQRAREYAEWMNNKANGPAESSGAEPRYEVCNRTVWKWDSDRQARDFAGEFPTEQRAREYAAIKNGELTTAYHLTQSVIAERDRLRDGVESLNEVLGRWTAGVVKEQEKNQQLREQLAAAKEAMQKIIGYRGYEGDDAAEIADEYLKSLRSKLAEGDSPTTSIGE